MCLEVRNLCSVIYFEFIFRYIVNMNIIYYFNPSIVTQCY